MDDADEPLAVVEHRCGHDSELLHSVRDRARQFTEVRDLGSTSHDGVYRRIVQIAASGDEATHIARRDQPLDATIVIARDGDTPLTSHHVEGDTHGV